MKILICALLIVTVNAVQFKVTQNDTTCAMLEISGEVVLSAKNESTAVGQTYTIPFSNATLLDASDCNTVKLNLSNAQVWFQKSYNQVQPVAAFIPNEFYPEDATKDLTVFTAALVGNFMSNQSFMCKASLEHKFSTSANTTLDYTLTATTMNLQVQFGTINGTEFSDDTVDCDADKTTTQTTPTTSTGTPSTLPPAPEKFSANVTSTDGNKTCIMLEGAFTIAVSFEDTVDGKKVNVTKYLNVPTTAKPSGNCSVNGTLQSMMLTFENTWNMGFMFAKSSSENDASISISEISVTYDTSVFGGAKVTNTVTVPKTEFLKSGTDGYYLCNSNSTIAEAQNVMVTSTNLKYKAFNTDNKPINGNVSECPADEETSSVVPIAVGAALAGLVVIVLIAYLIGRRRARKTGYESV